MSDENSSYQAIIDAAQEAVALEKLDPRELYTTTVPSGARLEVLDLEKYLPEPRRERGRYTFETLDSLMEYVDRHHDDSTTVWVALDGKVHVVIDDHEPGEPQWREHIAALTLKPTPEWTHWSRCDGMQLGQAEFADHIEDGLTSIAAPDGATLLEMVQTFHATVNATYKSAQRITNGEVQLAYIEEVNATAGRQNDLTIPEAITLSIAPFYGLAPEQLNARIRYRIPRGGGDLKIGYKLDRPHEVIERAIDAMVVRLQEKFNRVYRGQAPS